MQCLLAQQCNGQKRPRSRDDDWYGFISIWSCFFQKAYFHYQLVPLQRRCLSKCSFILRRRWYATVVLSDLGIQWRHHLVSKIFLSYLNKKRFISFHTYTKAYKQYNLPICQILYMFELASPRCHLISDLSSVANRGNNTHGSVLYIFILVLLLNKSTKFGLWICTHGMMKYFF